MSDEQSLPSASTPSARPMPSAEPAGIAPSHLPPRGQIPPATDGTARRQPNPPRDLRQELTDRMAAALGEGTIPWERPWHELKVARPRNVSSARDYRGGNRFLLMMVQLEKGYTDPRFGTVRQINQLGGTIVKGQKGFPVEYWSDQPFYDRHDVKVTHGGQRVAILDEVRQEVLIQAEGSPANRQTVRGVDLLVHHDSKTLSWQEAHKQLDRWIAKVSTVFNAEQCEGLTLEPIEAVPRTQIQKIERAEQLMAGMRADGLTYGTDNRGAYYVPKVDTVYLPEPERFRSSEAYYGTALHEIGHATGAEERLNREGIVGDYRFGSGEYAREELRAELFSVFMAAETGIPHDESQHRAYIQHWGKLLKSDKHEIFRAAAQASAAIDYVFEREQEFLKTRDRAAEVQASEIDSSEVKPGESGPTIEEAPTAELPRAREPRLARGRPQGHER